MKTAKEIIKDFYSFTESDFAEDASPNLNAFDAMEMINEALNQVNNLRKPDVSGRSEQLKSFYQFLENRGLIDTNRDCSDEWVKEYEKTL